MTQSAGDRFAIVLDRAERPDFDVMQRATGIIADCAGLAFVDARRVAQVWPGILLRDLDRAQAEAIATELSGLGIGLSTIAESDLPDIGAAVALFRMTLDRDGFEPNPGGTVALDPVRWEELAVICAGSVPGYKQQVTADTSPGVCAYPYRVVVSGPKREIVGTRRTSLDLVAGYPRRRLHIDLEYFSFRCLGERMTPSRARNLALLVSDLTAAAPQAQHNLRLGDDRFGDPCRQWEQFHSPRDFDARVQWLLYRSEHIVDAEEGPAELPAPGD
jgi:hypothetical protein